MNEILSQSYDLIAVGSKHPDLHESLLVALANMQVNEKDIESSYRGEPNISAVRLSKLIGLLRDVSNYKDKDNKRIDLLVFPEASVPYQWEAMLVIWARKHNIGIICGLEHKVVNKIAYNEILAALPYREYGGVVNCLPIRRLKQWYSPEEKFFLSENRIKTPTAKKDLLQLISWRGATFSIYNCYELTDIASRGLFVGKVDFLVALELNKDVNYFSNIVESAARDVHCYVIQVNDSKFGDTRIVSPSKTEKMNPLRIKGGENLTFLAMRLDLRKLRDFQRVEYGLQKESDDFKPTPPQFDSKDVLARIGLGKKRKLVG